MFSLAMRVDVYAADQHQCLLTIRQDSWLQWLETTYTVYDAYSQPIGNIRYSGWLGLNRWGSYWGAGGTGLFRVHDPGLNEIAVANPDPGLLGIPLNFVITRPDGALLGQFTRRLARWVLT